MRNSYKSIEFAEGYNRPFADFKQEFENVKVFRDMRPKERLKELKVAHKIATHGNTSSTVRKSKKANTRQAK